MLFFARASLDCSGTQPQESCLTLTHTWCPFLHHPSAHQLPAISLPILAPLNLRPSRGHRVCVCRGKVWVRGGGRGGEGKGDAVEGGSGAEKQRCAIPVKGA